MSDAPKRRTRAWIGGALFAAFVLYPLSSGPEYFIADRLGINDEWITQIYAPFGWVVQRWQPLEDTNEAHFEFWAGFGEESQPLGDF